jgi:hypothetical protein
MPGYGKPYTKKKFSGIGRDNDNNPLLDYTVSNSRKATGTTAKKSVEVTNRSTHYKNDPESSQHSVHKKNMDVKDRTSPERKREILNRFERSDDNNRAVYKPRKSQKI